MKDHPINQGPNDKNPILDALSGHNRVAVLAGVVLGMAAAFAASKGLITPQSAIPGFGWIVFGLLGFELAYGAFKKASPETLISMPGRITALVAGVGVDMMLRKMMGVV